MVSSAVQRANLPDRRAAQVEGRQTGPHQVPMRTLDELHFSNSFAALPGAFHTRLSPTPLADPHPVSLSAEPRGSSTWTRPRSATPGPGRSQRHGAVPKADPVASLYAGHPFGQWVPQLGDGRALLLGEVTNARGERSELQLKGVGLTPYSRDGDGRAVLRSSIREYLCSEAMHALGIPTTRALALFASDEAVYRERIETGAILVRMAQSDLRFGSFEVFFYRGQYEHLATLADYLIDHHYSELREAPGPTSPCWRRWRSEPPASLPAGSWSGSPTGS
jgi:uncharacterized protein YdiU (UPF0061 family)